MAALSLSASTAQAEEKEPSAVVEFGSAGEWSLRDGGFSFGPTVAVEVTPVKDWLEIEAGVATLFGGGHMEWGTDLLFKKPFTLSDALEFMVGAGPEWTYTTSGAGKFAGEYDRHGEPAFIPQTDFCCSAKSVAPGERSSARPFLKQFTLSSRSW